MYIYIYDAERATLRLRSRRTFIDAIYIRKSRSHFRRTLQLTADCLSVYLFIAEPRVL
jgi:hypothetical protein